MSTPGILAVKNYLLGLQDRICAALEKEDDAIVQEASFVLSLVHPDNERSEGAVRAIASEYKSRFNQEAVLRLKSHVCASF